MKLSIFADVKNPLPKSKEEKSKEAKFASRPYLPQVVEISNETQLIETVCNFAWSPFVFKKARLQEDFLSTDFLVLDIDSGLTIQESEKRVEEANMTCLCVPSTSHKPDSHHFRLIFPLSRAITQLDEFIASMNDLVEAFPESDPACVNDTARYYFSHTQDDGYWFEGGLLEPTKPKEVIKQKYDRPDTTSSTKVDLSIAEIVKELYTEEREFIPEAVDFFIKEAKTGISGNWNNSLNRFVFVLALQNIDYDTVYDLVEYLAPEPLSKSDIATIDHSYKDGEKHRDI